MSANIRFLVSYRGTHFCGWQKQPGLRTVQGHLEEVAARVCHHPVNIIGAGRTDSGVHAAGQVANFVTESPIPPHNLGRAINGRLDDDVAVLHARAVRPDFHAAKSALSKLYRYRIFTSLRRPARDEQFVYHYWRPLDLAKMKEAARHIEGEHDFTSLAGTGDVRPDKVRTVYRCEISTHFDEVRVDVHGDGFLYHMVRNIVGTLLEVGRGRWTPDRIPAILAARDNRWCGPTAPAHGLCLQWVRYPAGSTAPTCATAL